MYSGVVGCVVDHYEVVGSGCDVVVGPPPSSSSSFGRRSVATLVGTVSERDETQSW